MNRQERIEAKLKRHMGVSPEQAKKLAEFNEAQQDWWGICRNCGTRRTGTPKQLRQPCPDCGGHDGQ